MAFNIWKPDEVRSVLMSPGEEKPGIALKMQLFVNYLGIFDGFMVKSG